DVEVDRRAAGDGADLAEVKALGLEEVVDGDGGVERLEAVVAGDDDVAVGFARRGVDADGVDDRLDGVVGGRVRGLDVAGVAVHLGPVLAVADGVRVGRVGRLPRVVEQELVLRAVRFLDVDHHQVGAGVLLDGAQGDLRLVGDEGLDLV